jgi:hypothetical protein
MLLMAVICIYLTAFTWIFRRTEDEHSVNWMVILPGFGGMIGSLAGRYRSRKRALREAGRPSVWLRILPPWSEVFLWAGVMLAVAFALPHNPESLIVGYSTAWTILLIQTCVYVLRGNALLTEHGVVIDKMGGVGFVSWRKLKCASLETGHRDSLLRIKMNRSTVVALVPAEKRQCVAEILATAHLTVDGSKLPA